MTQCLRTLTTLIVETLLVMEHFLLAASWNVSLPLVGKSGGLPEPAVAAANATAALAELDLLNRKQKFLEIFERKEKTESTEFAFQGIRCQSYKTFYNIRQIYKLVLKLDNNML